MRILRKLGEKKINRNTTRKSISSFGRIRSLYILRLKFFRNINKNPIQLQKQCTSKIFDIFSVIAINHPSKKKTVFYFFILIICFNDNTKT